MPGKPFQSKLEPHYDFIRDARLKRWTYKQIAEAITGEHGLQVSANAVFSFVKVRAKGHRQFMLPAKSSASEKESPMSEFFTSPTTNPPNTNESKRYRLNF